MSNPAALRVYCPSPKSLEIFYEHLEFAHTWIGLLWLRYGILHQNLHKLTPFLLCLDFVNLLEVPISRLANNYQWTEVFPSNFSSFPLSLRGQVAESGRRLHHANTLLLSNKIFYLNHNLALITGTGKLKFSKLYSQEKSPSSSYFLLFVFIL